MRGFRCPFTIAILAGLLSGAVPVEAKPLWKIWQQAREAADVGRHDLADKHFTKARKRSPEDPTLAYEHAVALVEADRLDAALVALETSVALGFRFPRKLEETPVLAPLRDRSGFDSLLEGTRANRDDYRSRLREARRPIDPRNAPSFPDLDSLLAAREEEQRESQGPSAEPWELRQARFAERWAGALTRHADERRESPEGERAMVELLRARVDDAVGIEFRWPVGHAIEIRAAADRYVARYPTGEYVREARLAGIAADAAGVLPDEYDGPLSSLPETRCTEVLPALDELVATEASDPWFTAALGLRAFCLSEARPERGDEIREGARAYLETDPGATGYDLMLRGALKVALWRLDGPPAFEAEGLEGGKVTLADFAGKVTLLDFWSPG